MEGITEIMAALGENIERNQTATEYARLRPWVAAVAHMRTLAGRTWDEIVHEQPVIPEAQRGLILDILNHDADGLRETASHFLSEPVPFVTLVGKTGSGKTTMAYALAAMYSKIAAESLLARAERACEAAKKSSTFGNPSTGKIPKVKFFLAKHLSDCRRFSPLGDTPKMLAEASSCDIAIIDDIVGMRDPDGDLYDVIWNRDNDRLPTILTTAMSPTDMTTAYSEMFSRRVFGGFSMVVRRKERK